MILSGCFSKIFIVSRSALLDHSFILLREWAEKHLGQDNKQERFVFTSLAESSEDLMRIFLEHEKLVAKEKHQRKADKSKAPLSPLSWILDDVTDESALRDREGFLPREGVRFGPRQALRERLARIPRPDIF